METKSQPPLPTPAALPRPTAGSADDQKPTALEKTQRLRNQEARQPRSDRAQAEKASALIAENLHRAELTVQEPADNIARWVTLTGQKAQVAPIESKRVDDVLHAHRGGSRAPSRLH